MTKLTSQDRSFLIEMCHKNPICSPLERFLMDTAEIKSANKLTKIGLLEKGINEEGLTIFYADPKNLIHTGILEEKPRVGNGLSTDYHFTKKGLEL